MRLIDIPGQAVESVLSIVGMRIGTEEPHYLASKLTDRVEMRRYGPRIAAETTVAADDERARSIGFRRLAGYIFGANHRDEKIAMTAPVSQESGDRDRDDRTRRAGPRRRESFGDTLFHAVQVDDGDIAETRR